MMDEAIFNEVLDELKTLVEALKMRDKAGKSMGCELTFYEQKCLGSALRLIAKVEGK